MIAIIAGTGSLPIQACKVLLAQHKDFFVISLFPEDNQEALRSIIPNKYKIITHAFYKAHMIMNDLKEHRATDLLFIGKVDKRNLLRKFKLDWFAIKIFASLRSKSDKTIMERLVAEVENHNIRVLSQKDILESLLVKPGILTGTLTPELQGNISFGIHAAQQISHCDVGQTVIVKDKMILAVEAIEGTDACIKRGIELGKKHVIICKAAHPSQSKKYDLPTLGPQSLTTLKKGAVSAIAWESTHTFILDKEAFVARAKDLGITLVSI